MSNWTHVAGIARIDYMPYTDTEKKIKSIIVKELQQIIKKYPSPRRTSIVME